MMPYMVMDYVEGSNLADYIRTTSRIRKYPSPVDIVHLFTRISTALDYVYQRGLVHGNIKPSNILLSKNTPSENPSGMPLLTDCSIPPLQGTSGRILGSSWQGNPFYLSPEQAEGAPGNEFSDVYSLGVILYEICTGVVPFQGDTPAAILEQHVNATPPPPALLHPYIPPAVTLVIMRSMAKDPAARFANAASMTAALAEAFGLPVPESLSQPASSMDALNTPTHYKLRKPHLPSGTTVSSPELPIVRASTPPPPEMVSGRFSAPQQHVSQAEGYYGESSSKQNIPLAPASGTSGVVPSVNIAHTVPIASTVQPLPGSMLTSTPTAVPKKRRKGLMIAVVILLLLALIGSGLSALYVFSQKSPATTSKSLPIVGNAFFESSGLLSKDSTQGINDQLLITLRNIPPPAPGKSYYAWLLEDKTQQKLFSISLGKLAVDGGNVHFLYPGNPQHSNLLETTSRLLVTEEAEQPAPATPAQDTHTWRYYAELPLNQMKHVRSLLTGDPPLEALGLQGGLDIWCVRNTARMLEWAGSARDDWNSKSVTLIRDHLERILNYLTGPSSIQAGVSNQARPGYGYYLDSIDQHLTGILNAPGATQAQRITATQIKADLKNIRSWLVQMRRDAERLQGLADQQLLLDSSLLIMDDMTTQALHAYSGRLNPVSNEVQGGVIQIHYNLGHLANFEITQYKS
jgi:serine/threonine protein kinase